MADEAQQAAGEDRQEDPGTREEREARWRERDAQRRLARNELKAKVQGHLAESRRLVLGGASGAEQSMAHSLLAIAEAVASAVLRED